MTLQNNTMHQTSGLSAERSSAVSGQDNNLNGLTVVEAATLIAKGQLSSEELVLACLDRALSRENDLYAWAYLNAEQAILEARQRDKIGSSGLLHGVPIAVKDVYDVTGMTATFGSPIYKDHFPSADAASVALLRAAGAVIIGKTAAVEFSASEPTKTRNPNNLAHTPGGSSSGSAAVVADRQVAAATGTQCGGSVIRPAAYCGIVGFKASFGALCLAGTKMCSWSLDTGGVLTRNVADAARMYAVMAGAKSVVINRSLSAPRVGIFLGPFAAQADECARSAVLDAAVKLGAKGVDVTSIDAPPEFERTLEAQRIIARYEMARSLAYEWQFKRDLLSTRIQAELIEGLAISVERYRQAQNWATAARSAIASVLNNVDILLAIATTGEAPEGLGSTGSTTFNSSWSLSGNPCLCLPFNRGPRGLPIAIQLVGRFASDDQFLQHAAFIENALSN